MLGLVQINGALPQAYPGNVNRTADYACIVFIFIYTFGYSLGFGPAAWVYGSEVRESWRVPGELHLTVHAVTCG